MKYLDLLLAKNILLDERTSKINGRLEVFQNLAFGKHIKVGGITQSGGVIESIWGPTLKRIYNSQFTANNCLILGLGGGTAAKLVRKYWPNAKITGVEIDPLMVEMGRKYLDLEKTEAEIVIEDAEKFLIKHKSPKFDLILNDVYIGKNVPEKFESENYIRLVKSTLSKSGVVVFNRFYGEDKRPGAVKFGKKLEGIFSEVEYFYPEANLMLICKK